MKKSLLLTGVLVISGLFLLLSLPGFKNSPTGAPPYYVEEEQPPSILFDEYAWVKDWKRPEGPARIGLQVGHWKNEEVPEELHRLRGNTGATGGGKNEWQVNMEIAEQTKKILENRGVIVDILPATIPPGYWADAFVAIHADGSDDPSKTGFKAATPRRDLSGKASRLLELVESAYADSTGLQKDYNVTRNMKGYYAFSYWRYQHAVHPMTTSLILETGFLTSPDDRQIIISKSHLSAAGLADGLLDFLIEENLIE